MLDLFEYPTLTSTDAKEQIKELQNYLVQFKETLEFALTNISTDNLSAELRTELNSLGADIKSSNEERNDQMQQVTNRVISVSDILNSPAFESALNGKVETELDKIQFSVNFETGHLEYEIP